MTNKKICDECKKEVGRRWFELKAIYKEMDYGMEMDNGKYDFCSKKCLLNWLDKEEEFTKESEWYDR